MGEIAPFLVPITLFVSIAAVAIFRGPFGKALGERLGGHSVEGDTSRETEALHAEVEELRYRLSEVEERLDFTERMLAQQKSQQALPPQSPP